MKVLLAVDGSKYTKRMLGFLAAHDEFSRPDMKYTVFTVVPAVPLRARGYFSAQDLQRYYAEEAREVLDPIRAFTAQKGWTIDFRHCAGHAAKEIATLGDKEHFDLIVLGSHGHTALGGLVLGSVATAVLASCTTPVLIVRGTQA